MHFNSSLSFISMNKRCLYAPWSQVFCSADLVCSKQKGDSQRPTDRHVQSNMHSDKNCWTLRVDITNLKNNSGVAGTIYLVIFIGWDIMSLRIVTKFQEDLARTVWLRERSNLAAIHGCYIMSHFSNGHIIKGILHSMLICTAVPLHVPYIMSYDSIKPLSTYVSRHYKYSVCI